MITETNEVLFELMEQVKKVKHLACGKPQVLSVYVDQYNHAYIHLNIDVFLEAFRGAIVKSEKAGRYEHLSYDIDGVRFNACREIASASVEVTI